MRRLFPALLVLLASSATLVVAAPHASAAVSVDATGPRMPTSVTVRTDHSTYRYARFATVTGHLSKSFNSRKLNIYMTPYGGHTELIKSAVADVAGNVTVSHRVYRRTTFTVRFAGDFLYEPASASTTIGVHAHIASRLAGWYSTSGGYRVYHQSRNPVLDAQLYPHLGGVCLYFRAQHYYGGSWHNVAVSGCVRTDDVGAAAGVLTGDHVTGEPYRLRAEWRGNVISLPKHGVWLKLEFR